jgi:hypothetical protein
MKGASAIALSPSRSFRSTEGSETRKNLLFRVDYARAGCTWNRFAATMPSAMKIPITTT